MDIDDVLAIATRLGWPAQHVDYLRSLAKPAVSIGLVDGDPRPGGSRFGGQPFVPPEFTWPHHPVAHYRFIGQFNFGELAPSDAGLPDCGLLALFYAHEEDGEVFWRDPGYVLGFYWPDVSRHALLPEPADVKPTPAVSVKLSPSIDLPRHRELRSDWPFKEAADRLSDIATEYSSKDHLLGYPCHRTLGYDPTPGADWTALLTLESHDELDWYWQDANKLMVFIQKERLLQRDFSHLKCDAG